MTVTIGSTTYLTYATVAQADKYLEADFGASVWRAPASADNKARALVTATRVLDRMDWLGDRAEDDQQLAWPRINTGVSSVIDDEVPQAVIDASIELANAILIGADVANNPTTSSGIKSQKAGSVAIEYFRDFDVVPGRLPLPAMELIGYLLGGDGSVGGAFAFGTDACSYHEFDYRPNGGI